MSPVKWWSQVVFLLSAEFLGEIANAGEHVPFVAPASKEAEQAMARFDIPKGFKVELVAAEPLLANPVAFCIDEKGRFFIAETFRTNDGVPDNRWFMYWLADDLASRTVDDRIAMYRKHRGAELDKWAVESERVRRVVDSDGDGKADLSTVFADGFHNVEDGIASGVLARDNDVWFTSIPDLWKFRDANDDGIADDRKSLHHGYGVHVAFFGHDLHGLIFGPDGKLYYSIGDRGLHVETPNGVVSAPDCGSVLRCNPDGSELEIFATGLRNPQELAFDEFGNLFTGDNNSDSGDRARIVYVVEGGDSGWRMPYQYIERPIARGAWNEDKLWQPAFTGQAAYIVPPIANFTDGPSGLTYNPGVGLPPAYDRNFFLVDFRGSAAISGVRRFRLDPKGAGFELADKDVFVWKVVATDIDFGYDGAMYLLDWVDGWTKTGKGRIYRIYDPATRSAAADVAKIMAQGFDKLDAKTIEGLLSHADMRVRQRAQFALAKRPAEASDVFGRIANQTDHRLARLHAIWGMGQIARLKKEYLSPLVPLLKDADAEVRAQAAKTLGDLKYGAAFDGLLRLLKDESPRVRMFAAIALGRIGNSSATPELFEMLKQNDDADPYLRHGGVMGLVGCNDVKGVLNAAKAGNPESVRRAALLAMRRWKSPEMRLFLDPSGEFSIPLAEEAARAIYDVPIPDALPALASLANRDKLPNTIRRRSLYANARLGGPEHARAIATVAADENEPEKTRVEALQAISSWANPPVLDPVTGFHGPLGPRPDQPARDEFAKIAKSLMGSPYASLAKLAVETTGRYKTPGVAPTLIEAFRNDRQPPEVRAAALQSLSEINSPEVKELVADALDSQEPVVRSKARQLLAKVDPAAAVASLAQVLDSGAVGEKQQAFATLAEIDTPAADELLVPWLDRLLAGDVTPETRLDLRQAAAKRSSAEVQSKLKEYESKLTASSPAERYRDALVGGSADRGKVLLFEKTSVACIKCHKMLGRGGEVGPDLTRIAAKNDRQYLLDAIVDPNKKIAEGFDTSILLLADGQVKTGVVRKETDDELILYDSEGRQSVVRKSDVEERQRGKSAMPEDLVQKLSETELRDLIEYLASRN